MPINPIKAEEPSAKHRAFIERLADLDDFRTIGEKALECGYNAEYGRTLARDSRFAEWVLQRTRENVRGKMSDIYRGLTRDATSCELPIDRHRASKIVMQATGEIQPGNIEINQTTVTLQVPERLVRHLEERKAMLKEVVVVEHKGNGSNGNGGAES